MSPVCSITLFWWNLKRKQLDFDALDFTILCLILQLCWHRNRGSGECQDCASFGGPESRRCRQPLLKWCLFMLQHAGYEHYRIKETVALPEKSQQSICMVTMHWILTLTFALGFKLHPSRDLRFCFTHTQSWSKIPNRWGENTSTQLWQVFDRVEHDCHTVHTNLHWIHTSFIPQYVLRL